MLFSNVNNEFEYAGEYMKKLDFFAKCDDGSILNFRMIREGDVKIFSLTADSFTDKKTIEISSDCFVKKTGDFGYYLLPGDEKASGTALINFNGKGEGEEIKIDNPSHSFFAVASDESVYVVMIDNTYYYNLKTSLKDGKYEISLLIKTEAQPVEDEIILRVITLPFDSDYNRIAKAIRSYRLERGEIRPLKEKCSEREALEYARMHPLVRVRMGWKPVPSEVPHQTLENEPPMHVACTFSDVRFLADKMKELGVDGAEISLVGWNVKGHDGRWPDLLPVEETLGGEEELRKTVQHVRNLGYKLTCHTNHADHYEIASTFNFDDIVKRVDGSYKTHGNWGGGTAYASCPSVQLKYADRDAHKLAELGFFGLHYVDCLSLCRPEVCFDSNHPVKLSESIDIYKRVMQLYIDRLGGFSSEGMRDFSVGELDFSLYNTFRSNLLSFVEKKYEMIDSVVPMMELIYHGILLYNVSTATVNAVIKGDFARSLLALLGGKPVLYINSKFLSAKKNVFQGINNNWMGEEDLMSENKEDIEASALAVYRAAEEYKALADRQFVFIDSYKKLDNGICVTRYEDGVEIVANFGSDPAIYREKQIASGKYLIIRE